MGKFGLGLSALTAMAAMSGATGEELALTADAWQSENYHDRLQVDWKAMFGGRPCLAVMGATNKCDTAFSMVSKRLPVPTGSRELVVTVEGASSKFLQDVYKKDGSWNNALVWYGADGKKMREDELRHVYLASSLATHTVRDWQEIPSGAAGVSVRLGFDAPNLIGEDVVRYLKVSVGFVPPGETRAQEFAAAWKDGLWARDVLYPNEERKVPKITLRDDGITLVDGEPFFPIGIYSVCRREFNGMDFDRAFRDLKDAGFNFAQTYGDAYDPEFLAAAEKYGFKLWVECKLPDERFCKIGRNHPSILAWYLGDDTSAWIPAPDVTDRHRAVKALDPFRLTCQADSVDPRRPLSNYSAYVRATDVYMPEIYPVRGKEGDPTDRTCVAKTIWDMERVREDVRCFNDGQPRACWPILQWFVGWDMWQHFPTRAQLRATTWAAIVHGAHGMTWYTYGGFDHKKPGRNDQGITSTPERWQTISDLAHELGRWTPVLVERTPAGQPTVRILSGPERDPLEKGPSVTCLLKRHRGRSHLFAVNACPEPVTAEFALPDGSRVEETFAPFGVLTK